MNWARARECLGTLAGRPRRHHFLRAMPKGAVAAEIGVFRGEFTRRIIDVARPRELHLVDGWWELHGETFPSDWGEYADWGRMSTRAAHAEVERVVAAAPPGVACTVHVGDDLEVLAGFGAGYFDWVYLDTSHQYEQTLAELDVLADRVKPGGAILGHDWIDDPADVNHGASLAIREFCAERGWEVTRRDGFTQWEIRRAGAAQSISRR